MCATVDLLKAKNSSAMLEISQDSVSAPRGINDQIRLSAKTYITVSVRLVRFPLPVIIHDGVVPLSHGKHYAVSELPPNGPLLNSSVSRSTVAVASTRTRIFAFTR